MLTLMSGKKKVNFVFVVLLFQFAFARHSIALPGHFKISQTFTAAGLSGNVNAIVNDGSNWYVGGEFSAADGELVNHIAIWNGSKWESMADGFNDNVRALALNDAGDLYAAGDFTKSGMTAVDGIAKWSGTAWLPLAEGVSRSFSSASVYALRWETQHDLLYVGGVFDTAGVAPANNIATWDGASWNALANGTDSVTSIELGPEKDGTPTILAAGEDPPQQWDGTSWEYIGGWTQASPDGSEFAIDAMAYDPVSKLLYVGGDFTLTDLPERIRRLAVYGFDALVPQWAQLGPGTGAVNVLFVDDAGDLLVGGSVASAPSGIPVWSPQSDEWFSLPDGPPAGTLRAVSLNESDSSALFGGSFSQAANGDAMANVARVADANWSALSAIAGNATNGKINDMVQDADGNLYVGGRFSQAGAIDADNIAMWDGSNWSALGDGLSVFVSKLALAPNGDLYASGAFVGYSSIVKWDGDTWSDVASDLSGQVVDIAFDASGNLLAAGTFTVAGNSSIRVARRNGSAWSAVGNSFSLHPAVLFVAPDGTVYVAGSAGFQGREAVFKFDAAVNTWSALGEIGQSPSINSLAMTSSGDLIAAGRFSQITFIDDPKNIGIWTGSDWSRLGDGSVVGPNAISDMLYFGPDLIIAATQQGTIEHWNGRSWIEEAAFDSTISSLLLSKSQASLYAAGRFTIADSSPSAFLARLGSVLKLPHNEWRLFSLPLHPASGAITVEELFAGDINASYPSLWTVYAFDASTQNYNALDLGSALEPGKGYWVIQQTGGDIYITLPEINESLAGTLSAACQSDSGCFEKELSGRANASAWGLHGNPFFSSIPLQQLRVTTDSGSCSSNSGCSISEASTEGIIDTSIWSYNGSGYQTTDTLDWWSGHWARILPGANTVNPALLIPD